MRDFIFLRNQLFRDKEVISDVWLQSGKPGISQEAQRDSVQVSRDGGRAVRIRLHRRLRSRLGAARRTAGEAARALGRREGGRADRRRRARSSRRSGPAAAAAIRGSTRSRRSIRSCSTTRAPRRSAWAASAPISRGRCSSRATARRRSSSGSTKNAAASEKAWDQFDGVCGYYAVKDFKSGARVYARFGDPDTAIDNVQPIYMAGQFYGSGRVFFMASGEMWRVRAVDDAYFEQFYTKLDSLGLGRAAACAIPAAACCWWTRTAARWATRWPCGPSCRMPSTSR